MPYGMRSIQHDFYALCMCHVSYFSHWKNVSRDVYNMWHHDEFCLGSNRLSVHLHHFFIGFWVHGNIHFYRFDAPALGCQFKHGLHGSIILIGKDSLVTCFPRVARNNQVQGLGRISSQYHLFGGSTYQSG